MVWDLDAVEWLLWSEAVASSCAIVSPVAAGQVVGCLARGLSVWYFLVEGWGMMGRVLRPR